MFERIFKRRYYVVRHAAAPYAEERKRYLAECVRRGDARITVRQKAKELYWVACKLSVYGDLHVTAEQIRAAARDCDWKDRGLAGGHKINRRTIRKRFVVYAEQWLRYLGYLPPQQPLVPFHSQLEQFCRWAKEERGFTDATVHQYFKSIRLFLRWYEKCDRALSEVQLHDVDAYLAHGGAQGWRRVTVSNMA